MTSTLAKNFVCKLCVHTKEGIVEPGEKISFFDQIDFMKSFCYLVDRLNPSGGSEAAVTARTRIGWIKLREYGELLYRRKFSLKMRSKIYRSCVDQSKGAEGESQESQSNNEQLSCRSRKKSAMLYGSKTWCLRQHEMGILRRTEKAMMRAMGGLR